MKLKGNWWAWLLLALPGGIALTLVGLSLDLYIQIATGNDDADALRWPVIYGVLKKTKPLTPAGFADALQQARALMLVLLAENSFAPTDGYPGPVGDTGISKGPSISPWQILRTNAQARGYFTPATTDPASEYGAIDTLGNIFTWAGNAADFFADEVWPHANGDIRKALQVWNGGPNGPNVSAAVSYADNAISGSSPSAGPGAPDSWSVA